MEIGTGNSCTLLPASWTIAAYLETFPAQAAFKIFEGKVLVYLSSQRYVSCQLNGVTSEIKDTVLKATRSKLHSCGVRVFADRTSRSYNIRWSPISPGYLSIYTVNRKHSQAPSNGGSSLNLCEYECEARSLPTSNYCSTGRYRKQQRKFHLPRCCVQRTLKFLVSPSISNDTQTCRKIFRLVVLVSLHRFSVLEIGLGGDGLCWVMVAYIGHNLNPGFCLMHRHIEFCSLPILQSLPLDG